LRHVFGGQAFFVGDQMFWTQSRLDFAREAPR
jgi:2-hydroxychromene-2-carboxylate isomerase